MYTRRGIEEARSKGVQCTASISTCRSLLFYFLFFISAMFQVNLNMEVEFSKAFYRFYLLGQMKPRKIAENGGELFK